MQTIAVILAAGEGKRMKSALPKVLHKICSMEMVRYVLRAVGTDSARSVVVVGRGAQQVREVLTGQAQFVEQREQLGTGHAVMMARDFFRDPDDLVLVVAGDMPLLRRETLQELVVQTKENHRSAMLLSSVVSDATGYGRVLRDKTGKVLGIVEHRDASETQRRIKEVNASVYCFVAGALNDALAHLKTDNAQGEYYLTDCISYLAQRGDDVGVMKVEDGEECLGVNDLTQLNEAEAVMRLRLARMHMENGVRIMDPNNTYISPQTVIAPDVRIYPGNVIEGNSRIGSGTVLYPGNFLEGAVVGENARIGPNAHLRGGTVVGNSCRVGNFVELKNLVLKDGAKVSHLAYCGDGEIGERSNISCGAIFSNYDGASKFKTTVGKDVFVGCNANLVAPVNVQDRAYIAAGSTITEDVPSGALGIARARQVNKDGWALKRNKSKN